MKQTEGILSLLKRRASIKVESKLGFREKRLESVKREHSKELASHSDKKTIKRSTSVFNKNLSFK